MIWQASFLRIDGSTIRETVYPADDLHEAVILIADGDVEIPPGSAALRLELQAATNQP